MIRGCRGEVEGYEGREKDVIEGLGHLRRPITDTQIDAGLLNDVAIIIYVAEVTLLLH